MMETLPNEVENLVVCSSYFITGTLYLFYFFLIIIRKKLSHSIRFSLSPLFLVIGLFFYNEGGKLYTGGLYDEHLNYAAVMLSLLISITGLLVVYITLTNKES